jgi:choline dehydrogenase-like flavoprotein
MGRGRVPVEEARRYGADLVTRSHVVRAIVEQGEAVGVETRQGKKYFGKTVVLAAGGLGSPLILRASGVPEAGDKFGFDALWFTYGFHKDFPTVNDIDMGLGCSSFVESDGFVLSPVMHTWGMYLASATVGGGWSYLPKFTKFRHAVLQKLPRRTGQLNQPARVHGGFGDFVGARRHGPKLWKRHL